MRAAILFTFLLGLASAAVAAPAEPVGARAFIERVYAGYPRHTPRPEGEFYGLFDRELRALIVKNDHWSANEPGPLDGDPICDCQDDAGFSHRLVSVTGNARVASAKVRNIFGPPAPRSETLVTYRLVKQNGRWRISDISTAAQPSFKRWLADALAKAR